MKPRFKLSDLFPKPAPTLGSLEFPHSHVEETNRTKAKSRQKIDPFQVQQIGSHANQKWKELKDSGIPAAGLIQLAGAILGQIQQAKQGQPDPELSGLFTDVCNFDGLDDNADSYDIGQSNHKVSEDFFDVDSADACSTGGTINLAKSNRDPLIVSTEGFFSFCFEVSEGLNTLIECFENKKQGL